MSRRTTDLQLERYLAEALSGEELAQLRKTLEDSEEDRVALDALRADSAAFLVKQPPAAFAHRVAPVKAARPSWWVGVLTSVAAVLVAGFIILQTPKDDEVRTKGGHAWQVTVARDGQVRRAGAGPLHAGDVLSFEVTMSVAGFAAVVSHAPDGFAVYAPTQPVRVGVNVLEQAAALDGATGAEVLYLLVSTRSFDASAARQALEADPGMTHWNGVEVDRLALTKE